MRPIDRAAIGRGREAARTAVAQTAMWAAIAVALLAVGFDLSAVASAVVAPLPEWTGIEGYAAAFRPVQMLPDVWALLLAPAFVVLLVAVHLAAGEDRRVLTASGLLFAAIYAAIVSANYVLQLTVVRPNVLAGRTEGMAVFAVTNPHSIFWALEQGGYAFPCLATLAVAPAFSGGRLETWTRWLWAANGVAGLAATAAYLVLMSPAIVMADLAAWGLIFPAGAALTALVFRGAASRADPP